MTTEQITYVIPNGWESGIYKITAPEDYYYFGSTESLKGRADRHFSELIRDIHANPHMQNRFNKYPKGWKFEVVEKIQDITQLLIVEQTYLDTHHGATLCMNICKIAGRPPDVTGIKRSPEFCEKIRQARTGIKHSEERKANISAAKKGKTAWNKGKVGVAHTEEWKIKARERKQSRSEEERTTSLARHRITIAGRKPLNTMKAKIMKIAYGKIQNKPLDRSLLVDVINDSKTKEEILDVALALLSY
jgi:group I intron endonuclease